MEPWLRFTVGLVIGCWAGVLIGGIIALLFAGRRLKQLETANMLLRVKLRSQEKQGQRTAAGGGPILVVPPRDTNRPASAVFFRKASGDR